MEIDITETTTLIESFRFSGINKATGKEVARATLIVGKNDLHAEPFGYLEDVFTDDSCRQQGVAEKMVRRVIERAKELGCYKIAATSRDERPAVHRLYLRIGFTQHGKSFRIDF